MVFQVREEFSLFYTQEYFCHLSFQEKEDLQITKAFAVLKHRSSPTGVETSSTCVTASTPGDTPEPRAANSWIQAPSGVVQPACRGLRAPCPNPHQLVASPFLPITAVSSERPSVYFAKAHFFREKLQAVTFATVTYLTLYKPRLWA